MFCFAALVASGLKVDVVKEEKMRPQDRVSELSSDEFSICSGFHLPHCFFSLTLGAVISYLHSLLKNRFPLILNFY